MIASMVPGCFTSTKTISYIVYLVCVRGALDVRRLGTVFVWFALEGC